MNAYTQTLRLVVLALALFPTLWGILSFLNNTSGFDSTVEYGVKPILAMTDTYGNPAQTWRAITVDWAASMVLIGMTILEATAGVLGAIGMFKMIRAFRGSYAGFQIGKLFVIGGCTCAILVWGVGLMVIAGDWFLAWQGKTGLNTQLGAMIYVVPCFLTLITHLIHRED